MNLSDTFYIALCMAVLILGVVYFFWTQNQYIQRKLNLLENIVYEMKSSMSHGLGAPDHIDSVLAEAAKHEQEISKLADEDAESIDDVLQSFATAETEAVETTTPAAPALTVSEVPDAPESAHAHLFEPDNVLTGIVADEDLQPGGGAATVGADVSDTSNETVLNGMGLKELRELAKQKGVANAKTLRKHELVAAIRASKTQVTPFEINERTLELN